MTPPATDDDLGPPGPVLGLRAFRCGDWNDVPTDETDVRDLAENFGRFAAPVGTADPYLVPCVSLFHDAALSFGRVTRATADGEFLDLDLDGVPLTIRRWMKADRLASPSIEFWDPLRFVGPDGAKWPTRVLKLVTLLGSEAPGAKGLPPLSAATYPGLDDAADDPPTLPAALTPAALDKYRPAEGVSKFSDHAPATRSGGRRAMNPERQTMIDALVAAGFPAEQFTDAIPDPFLQAMLTFVQSAAQPPPKEMADADCDKPKAMADDDTDDDDTDGVQAFRDHLGNEKTVRVPKVLRPMAQAFATQLDALHATNAANAAARTRQDREGRAVKVRAFRDEMTKPDGKGFARMTPVQFDALEPMLLAADHAGVRKFADGKTDGTALEERCAALRASFDSPVRRFADAMPAGAAPGTRSPRPLAPGQSPKAADISPEVQAMLVSAGYGHHVANLK